VKQEGKQIKLTKSLQTLIETDPPIIKMEAAENEFFELEDIKEIHEANLKLSNGKPFCVLLDTSKGHFSVSPKANELLASTEYAKTRRATAMVVNSLATKMAAYFFIRFNKPPTPTRVFTQAEEALKWLKTFAE